MRYDRTLATISDFVQALKALARAKDGAGCEKVHRSIAESEHRSNVALRNNLIESYIQCGCLDQAQEVFDASVDPDEFSWGILFRAYARNGHHDHAKYVFDRMPRRCVVSWTAMLHGRDSTQIFEKMPARNIISFTTVLGKLQKSGEFSRASQFFAKLPERDVWAWTIMLQTNARQGNLLESKRVFDAMPQWSIVSWGAMIAMFTHHGKTDQADLMFQEMPQRDLVTANNIIAGYATSGNLERARFLYDKMPARDVCTYASIFETYSQTGLTDMARQIFNDFPQRDPHIWTSLLSAYSREGNLREVDLVLSKMPQRCTISLTAAMTAHAQAANVHATKGLFDQIHTRDVLPWNVLLMAYAEKGNLDKAEEVYAKIPHRNVFSSTCIVGVYAQRGNLAEARKNFVAFSGEDTVPWTTLLVGCAHSAEWQQAFEVFDAMNCDGISPNDVTFLGVLTACSYVGRAEEGRSRFQSMTFDHGVQPTLKHYHCVLDILGRAGRLEEAEELAHTMPFEPDEIAWTILLEASKTNSDVDAASRAAEKLDKAEGGSSSTPHLLLLSTNADRRVDARLSSTR